MMEKVIVPEKSKQIKKIKLVNKIPHGGWLVISLTIAFIAWWLLSINPQTARSFPGFKSVVASLPLMIKRGVFWTDIKSSLIAVVSGFTFGFILSLPISIVMAWYKPVQNILGPWIQFIKSIPPLAYVPLVVISAGVGRTSQVIVITIATFLTMTITMYQGVLNIDPTLIKAARVLGAKDIDIFTKVMAPASLPFIMTAIRLGSTTALTTLIAAESTGAEAGLGMRIRALNQSFEAPPMLLYIIVVGIIGLCVEKLVKMLEKRLTGWQEKQEI